MSLIHKLNGQVIQSLNVRAGGSSASSSSSISGIGSAKIGGDSVSLSAGLKKGSQLFAFSYRGLNQANEYFQQSIDKQESIQQTVLQLKQIAQEASDNQVSDNDRIQLNKEFKALLREYSKKLQTEESDIVNVLSTNDLKEILEDNGIDLSATTILAQAFNNSGGKDHKFGQEAVMVNDQMVTNISRLTVDTQIAAKNAHETLSQLENSINDDLNKTVSVSNELFGAMQFAIYGGGAFTDAANGLLFAQDAEGIARAIVNYIKTNTHDSSLAAHSDIDTLLAKELLGS